MLQYGDNRPSLIRPPVSAIDVFKKQLENHKIVTMCQK